MEITEIELRTPEGEQGFLEVNKQVLEQLAVRSLIDLMRSSTATPQDKLNAAKTALEAVGKAKPNTVPAQTTNNFQFNTAITPHITEALGGLGKTLALMGKVTEATIVPIGNAPQMEGDE